MEPSNNNHLLALYAKQVPEGRSEEHTARSLMPQPMYKPAARRPQKAGLLHQAPNQGLEQWLIDWLIELRFHVSLGTK